jgi:hypothetical protein
MGRWHIIFPPVTGRKILDRVVWGVSFLFVAGLLIVAVRGLIVGSDSTGGDFGFDGLWIRYKIRCGGLLPERFTSIVVMQMRPENQSYDGWTDMYSFTFPGKPPIQVRSAGTETIWVDSQGRVTNLGRVVLPNDIDLLETHDSRENSPISSPEEFRATLARLRAGEAVSSGKGHSETMPKFYEIEGNLACDASRRRHV